MGVSVTVHKNTAGIVWETDTLGVSPGTSSRWPSGDYLYTRRLLTKLEDLIEEYGEIGDHTSMELVSQIVKTFNDNPNITKVTLHIKWTSDFY